MHGIFKYFVLALAFFLGASHGSRSQSGSTRRRSHVTADISNDLEESNAATRVDPHGSWLSFVRHSDRNAGNKRQTKKNKGRRSGATLADQCEPGPPGPPGPQGPRGPPGAVVTEEVLMKEFKEMVRDEAARRAEKPPFVCAGCSQTKNATWRMVDVDEVNVIPRVAAGFHHRLRGNVVVHGRTFVEVKSFHRPFGGGAFQRGNVFSAAEGRFTAPRDAIYQLTANMHIAHDVNVVRRGQRKLRKRDNVRVLICIMSLCQKHTSLEFIAGLESNSRKFTVSITGLLHLEAGHYASIYVENSSTMAVTLLEGSDFSGVLIGV